MMSESQSGHRVTSTAQAAGLEVGVLREYERSLPSTIAAQVAGFEVEVVSGIAPWADAELEEVEMLAAEAQQIGEAEVKRQSVVEAAEVLAGMKGMYYRSADDEVNVRAPLRDITPVQYRQPRTQFGASWSEPPTRRFVSSGNREVTVVRDSQGRPDAHVSDSDRRWPWRSIEQLGTAVTELSEYVSELREIANRSAESRMPEEQSVSSQSSVSLREFCSEQFIPEEPRVTTPAPTVPVVRGDGVRLYGRPACRSAPLFNANEIGGQSAFVSSPATAVPVGSRVRQWYDGVNSDTVPLLRAARGLCDVYTGDPGRGDNVESAVGDDVNYRPRTMEVVADIHRADSRASPDVVGWSRAVSTGARVAVTSAPSLGSAMPAPAVRESSQPSRPGATSRQSVHSVVDGDVVGRHPVGYDDFEGHRRVAMEGSRRQLDAVAEKGTPPSLGAVSSAAERPTVEEEHGRQLGTVAEEGAPPSLGPLSAADAVAEKGNPPFLGAASTAAARPSVVRVSEPEHTGMSAAGDVTIIGGGISVRRSSDQPSSSQSSRRRPSRKRRRGTSRLEGNDGDPGDSSGDSDSDQSSRSARSRRRHSDRHGGRRQDNSSGGDSPSHSRDSPSGDRGNRRGRPSGSPSGSGDDDPPDKRGNRDSKEGKRKGDQPPSPSNSPSPSRRRSRFTDHKHWIKPEKYDGQSSFENFMVTFDNAAEFNRWDAKEKLAFLRASLTGVAVQLLWGIGSLTYDQLVKKLQDRFGAAGMEDRYQAELRCRRRRPGESIRELAQDIRGLMLLAYPGQGDSVLGQHIARDAFLTALDDPELQMKIRDKDPETLEEAVRSASRFEVTRAAVES